MTKAIKILALDDDIHEMCYCTEEGKYFSTTAQLFDFLCRPHGETYEIKKVALIDEDLPESLIPSFDYLHYGNYSMPVFEKRFAELWKYAKKMF